MAATDTPEPSIRPDQPVDPDAALELLDDEDAVALFQAATEPTAVPELADECDVAQSTAYRKVERLVEASLLAAVTPKTSNGSPPGRYERAVDGVAVTLADDLVVTCVDDD